MYIQLLDKDCLFLSRINRSNSLALKTFHLTLQPLQHQLCTKSSTVPSKTKSSYFHKIQASSFLFVSDLSDTFSSMLRETDFTDSP